MDLQPWGMLLFRLQNCSNGECCCSGCRIDAPGTLTQANRCIGSPEEAGYRAVTLRVPTPPRGQAHGEMKHMMALQRKREGDRKRGAKVPYLWIGISDHVIGQIDERWHKACVCLGKAGLHKEESLHLFQPTQG